MSAAIEQRNQDATVSAPRSAPSTVRGQGFEHGAALRQARAREEGVERPQERANLFLGNLDPEVDEKLLYDTFSAFGGIVETPKVMRDPDSQASRGFDSFEAADLAIECIHGQYLCNRQVVVHFDFKKDSRNERHGSEAERLLAQRNPDKLQPHTIFAFTPGTNGAPPPPPPLAYLAQQVPDMGLANGMGMVPPPPPPPMAYPPPPPPQR
ncbi:hypothetical protein PF008_g26532 [Phytophthora fragariae]|uniref:RRM domain-containing protein n=1 Tax=Phytophthora fragariae TaxID=53985 RepID=A0A6G0QGU3_9STRA|nr:hypothetical protein PF008_g26532 [Phytophthora fragariae]